MSKDFCPTVLAEAWKHIGADGDAKITLAPCLAVVRRSAEQPSTKLSQLTRLAVAWFELAETDQSTAAIKEARKLDPATFRKSLLNLSVRILFRAENTIGIPPDEHVRRRWKTQAYGYKKWGYSRAEFAGYFRDIDSIKWLATSYERKNGARDLHHEASCYRIAARAAGMIGVGNLQRAKALLGPVVPNVRGSVASSFAQSAATLALEYFKRADHKNSDDCLELAAAWVANIEESSIWSRSAKSSLERARSTRQALDQLSAGRIPNDRGRLGLYFRIWVEPAKLRKCLHLARTLEKPSERFDVYLGIARGLSPSSDSRK